MHKGKTWTVDSRLREFRFVVYGEMPEFVPFDSEKGLRLLRAYWKSQTTPQGNIP
jgi:hypothetical protein